VGYPGVSHRIPWQSSPRVFPLFFALSRPLGLSRFSLRRIDARSRGSEQLEHEERREKGRPRVLPLFSRPSGVRFSQGSLARETQERKRALKAEGRREETGTTPRESRNPSSVDSATLRLEANRTQNLKVSFLRTKLIIRAN
jgi:hypothetical protein